MIVSFLAEWRLNTKEGNMKNNNDTMRNEYDFRGGIRGKHSHALENGYTVTIHHEDGKKETKEIKPIQGAVYLEPDVQEYFPDSKTVNQVLRTLIRLIPDKNDNQ